MIGIHDIEIARSRIQPYIRQTPVMPVTCAKNVLPVDAQVVLKLECLQVTGSFKARGAMNRLRGSAQDVVNGIVTASGGNHGLAVARTACAANITATVFLPSNVSASKRAKIE